MSSDAPLAVLLVEDDPAEAILARSAIVEAVGGAVTEVATRVAGALDYLDHNEPDVILMDLGLPDSDGLEGVREISRRAPGTPIIVLSEVDDEKTALAALESGAQDYLTKGDHGPALLARAIRYAMERKRTERELLEAARFDAVTGLVNRPYFLSLLDHALDRGRRNGTSVDVLFLDLDHFKNVNDTLGHAAGDALLKQVGERIQNSVRGSDVVARLGGDEFTVMAEGVAPSGVKLIAEKILTAMRPGFTVAGVEVIVTPSIGVAGCADAEKDGPTLLQHADTAMYRAKALGRNTVEFFTEEMNTSVRRTFELEMALRHGLQRNEFEVHYQPIMDRVSGEINAVEALLRWNRGDGKPLLGPDHFLPVLERTGLITQIGDWVLRTACGQCRDWQRSLNEDLRVAVNVSPRQLGIPGFPERVAAVLAATGLAPASLEIEITEQVLLERNDVNIAMLKALREVGVTVAIDDFGSGYSSLGYLTAVPFDTIKIDRSFVDHVAGDGDDALITAGILSIAASLGRHTIAEGVETSDQVAFLTQHGCSEFQGFLFSQPLDADAFEEFHRGLSAGATTRSGRGFAPGRPPGGVPPGSVRARSA